MIRVTALRGAALVVHGGLDPAGFVVDGGCFDDRALASANCAIGNPWWAPGLEVLLGPITLHAERDCVIGVAGGGDVDVITSPAGSQRLVSGTALRTVIAVAGGIARAPGTPIAVGDPLVIQTLPQRPPRLLRALEDDNDDDDDAIRVVRGAEHDHFDDDVFAAFCERLWRVDPRSSRLGIRLQGDALRVPATGTDIVTRGAWTGAVQVLSSGLPVILGVDQRRTGGYARLAHVISVDRHRLAQLRPGHEARFVEIDIARARELRKAWAAHLEPT